MMKSAKYGEITNDELRQWLIDASLWDADDLRDPTQDIAATWQIVKKCVGLPEYAVLFAVWPYPEGGWMAGFTLYDKEWAEEQDLPMKNMVEDIVPHWSIEIGFLNGANAHGVDAPHAICNAVYEALVD